MPAPFYARRVPGQTEIRAWFPRLSQAQACVFGEMVCAILMIDGCGITRMRSVLSELLGRPMKTVRQRDREISDARAGGKKRRYKRGEGSRWRSIVRSAVWHVHAGAGRKPLVLALDGSTLADRCDVLSTRIATRGCGIRVAWTILAHPSGGGVDDAGDGRSGIVCRQAL